MSKEMKKRKTIGSLRVPEEKIDAIAKTLAKQIDKRLFEEKYAIPKEVLKLVGAGFFMAASLVAPNLPKILKPHFNEKEPRAYKRFNLPYLKRTLNRLEKQKLLEISQEEGMDMVKITNKGRVKILRFALDEMAIEKPKVWDGKWRLVSYDIPRELNVQRAIFSDYLKAWSFYPLHESLFLHAYPCEKEIEFLREYLGIGKYVRIFKVLEIENDKPFREFFGV